MQRGSKKKNYNKRQKIGRKNLYQNTLEYTRTLQNLKRQLKLQPENTEIETRETRERDRQRGMHEIH